MPQEPQDCPHDRCDFFVQNDASWCPACGGSLVTFDLRFAGSDTARIALVFVATLGTAMLAWQLGTAGFATAVLTAIIGTAGGLVSMRRSSLPAVTTLDDRYGQAVRDAEQWLETWGALFARNANDHELLDDERVALLEARAAAADAAAEACARRDEFANRYLTNAFDRLTWLGTRRTRADRNASADLTRAVAIVDQYLERLWMDPGIADQGRHRLQALVSHVLPEQRRRSDVIDLVDRVRLFEEADIAVSGGRRADADDLESQIYRLRAERALLEDARRLDL